MEYYHQKGMMNTFFVVLRKLPMLSQFFLISSYDFDASDALYQQWATDLKYIDISEKPKLLIPLYTIILLLRDRLYHEVQRHSVDVHQRIDLINNTTHDKYKLLQFLILLPQTTILTKIFHSYYQFNIENN